MYVSHFGLKHPPFRATLGTQCYYPATSHENALAALAQAVNDDEGLILLMGEPGTGKTMLCHLLLDRLGATTATVFLTNSHFSDRLGLLQAILYDLSIPYEGKGEQELRLRLTDFLLNNFREGRRTVVLIDEAQNLAPMLLEELRLWGNLEARDGKAVQVILVAQPQIGEVLHRRELVTFSQRLSSRIHLEPLSVDETADYLVHRLRVAGGRPERILTEEAIQVLARATQGVPRLLNQAAHQALALACSAELPQVDVEVALEALETLGLECDESLEEPYPPFDPEKDQPSSEGDGDAESSAVSPAANPGPGYTPGPTAVDQEIVSHPMIAPPRQSA